jgi:predicted exporter
MITDAILSIYDYLRSHRAQRLLSLLALTCLMVLFILHLNYKEDISDFLPLDNRHQQALRVYQESAGANRLLAIFQSRDTTAAANPDELVESIETFLDLVPKHDTASVIRNVTAQVDLSKMTEVMGNAYHNIPYFLTDDDYARMDSALRRHDYAAQQLEQAKQMLLFPAGGLLSENIQRDPLNLFTPVVSQLQQSQTSVNYELYDGYIFSADLSRAIIMLDSPYGASETEHNARLLTMLNGVASEVEQQVPAVNIHYTGGPVIAVGNANQIKTDSMLSVAIAVVIIVLLLYVSFRNVGNLLLIIVSIGWGWLFAMSGVSLFHNDVSIIVIGISSVILGIAVNYPLHLIDHLSHATSMRSALKDIVMPLLIGNITTVGAFLTLVPLQSVALRDLGLFSSLLLVGTIVFVLLYLPHAAKKEQRQPQNTLLHRLGSITLDDKPWVVVPVIVLTLIFGWFSMQTTFDANIGHINYMTPEQKADMTYFQKMMTGSAAEQKVYVMMTDSTTDAALDHSAALHRLYESLRDSGYVDHIADSRQFRCSQAELQQRITRWNQWTAHHRDTLLAELNAAAARAGFAPHSFDEFRDILTTPVSEKRPQLAPELASLLGDNKTDVVDVLTTPAAHTDHVRELLNAADAHVYSFNMSSMNSAIASRLSDNFNYIGWACSFIVFFFLWFSLGNIELALLSFLPMAVSWLWILGLMALFGIQFNIVNVILATFIFGQGDDYTIFMTEGSCYEYAYRRRMLASYKHSIMLSALIMFIGIGSLIVARHPALHSLAEVTILGMFSVVLMAYIFPPLIFRWLVSNRQGYRRRPITLRRLLLPADNSHYAVVSDRYRYRGVEIASAVRRNLRYCRRHPETLPKPVDGIITINDDSWGETGLLLALTYPDASVQVYISDEERRRVACYAAEDVVTNLQLSDYKKD